MAYHWYSQYSPPSFSLSLSSPSTNKAALVLERDFLSSVEEHNYGMSGLDVTLSLRPPLGDCKKCSACGETKTPLWRNGPDGPKTLCNACGIRYRKEAMKINTNLSLAPPDHVLHFSAQGKGAFC